MSGGRSGAFIALASLALAAPAAAAAPAIEGLWLTDDGSAVVRIEACGDRMCGRIARVLDTRAGVPQTDVTTPDASRRNRPLIGLQILSGYRRGASRWEDGRAYDPKTGNSYNSSLRLDSDGSLRVTGCVLFVCRSKRWTRTG